MWNLPAFFITWTKYLGRSSGSPPLPVAIHARASCKAWRPCGAAAERNLFTTCYRGAVGCAVAAAQENFVRIRQSRPGAVTRQPTAGGRLHDGESTCASRSSICRAVRCEVLPCRSCWLPVVSRSAWWLTIRRTDRARYARSRSESGVQPGTRVRLCPRAYVIRFQIRE